MCTLAFFFKMYEDSPVLLFANRDEQNNRAWEPPGFISRIPRIFAPRDTQAGGTWLGVNEAGLLVTITNHFGTLATGSSLCSRGFVVAEALRHETAGQAKALVELLSPQCKAYTMLVADPKEAFVIDHSGGNGSTITSLEPGMHVVTNARFRTAGDEKAQRVLSRMRELAKAGKPGVAQASDFLGDHHFVPGISTPLCTHAAEGSRFATVSASVVELGAGGELKGFHFAPGPPCVTGFEDVTPDLSTKCAPA